MWESWQPTYATFAVLARVVKIPYQPYTLAERRGLPVAGPPCSEPFRGRPAERGER